MKPTIGFIGLGMMGAPMAARLIQSGYILHVNNRSKEKAAGLISNGARWNNSPSDVAANADIVCTMLTNDNALRTTASAIQTTMKGGGIHIDCSTVSPSLTSILESEYTNSNRGFIHAPVLGSIPQATDGTLLLFVGGKDEAFLKTEPLFHVLGSTIWRFPVAQQASTMKLIMNSFIGGMIATLSQALAVAQQSQIDGSVILEILSHSALNSPMYQTKGQSILQNNFAPRFFLENLLKDINLFRDAATSVNASTPIADTVHTLLERAVNEGLAKEDYSAISKLFSRPVRQ